MLPVTRLKISSLFILLTCFVAMTVATYINRYPTGDDGWFAEQSYWLHRQGVIRSEFFRGIAGWENGLLVSHKLFLAFGAVLIHFFGDELPVLKFTGLSFFLVLIAELIIYIRQRESRHFYHYLLSILILVFCNRVLIKMSFENRPEMMLAALGFGSFLLMRSKSDRFLALLASGLLAGLAVVTHLNGIIYVVAGAFCLLSDPRRIKKLFIFLLGAALGGSLYLIDILSTENGWSVWWFQLRNDPATQTSFHFQQKLVQILTFPSMFFRSPEQLALSVLLIYLMWVRRKSLTKLPAFLSRYTLALLGSFWLITKANTGLYMVLFIPFMLALVYELYILEPGAPVQLRWVLALYFLIGIYGSGQIIYKNQQVGYLPDSYLHISKRLPKSAVGLVPLTFFFNDYHQFNRLLTHENYKLHFGKRNLTFTGFAKWANSKHINFILVDYQFLPESFFPPKAATNMPFYKRKYFDGRFAIFFRTGRKK